jgi:hypothetical protein
MLGHGEVWGLVRVLQVRLDQLVGVAYLATSTPRDLRLGT